MDLFRKKKAEFVRTEKSELHKCLSAFDLVLLGVGAIIGAGIFVLTGVVAATQAGPAIVFSYVLAGAACAFSALSYAELAASIGGCGSAYGYSYAGFGELIAWVVGWDLLLEYGIATSAVSVGWSGYANDLLHSLHISLPEMLQHGPLNGGVINLMALLVVVFLTLLLSIGIKSSAYFNNLMVMVKLFVIGLFMAVATFNVKAEHWAVFMPFGWQGVVEGASMIFFAYIGFDAVSTAAEEALEPQRDLPIGIIGSLLVCTILYIIVSGLLTAVVPYDTLNTASPITNALLQLKQRFVAGLVGVGAIAGLTTVMLVLFYGLSRVFLAMARDGLLPHWFATTNPVTQTPLRIILIAGMVMAITGGFMPIDDLAELVNIGTLFAFMLVCAGVIVMRYRHPELPRPFKTPFMPLVPFLGIVSCAYLIYNLPFATMLRFVIWMLVGIIIYFLFGVKNSRLNSKNSSHSSNGA